MYIHKLSSGPSALAALEARPRDGTGDDRMATIHFEEALLADGWASDVRLTLAGSAIAAIETGAAPSPADERHAVGLPGMPNLHSHAFQRAMAGLTEVRGPVNDTFWTWREAMYRFSLAMDPDEAEAVAAGLYAEMLEAGFTAVGEFHYLHHDRDGRPYADPAEMARRIAAAARQTGIRLTLLPVYYAQSGFGGLPPVDGQRRFISDPDLFARLVEGARAAARDLGNDANVGIAPHSLRAVTPDGLRAVLPLGRDGPIHIHAAEQIREVEDCLAWSGARPVEWLLDHAGADDRWCFIHATHMTADETVRMAAAGVTAGLCPLTEASLGDGTFNGPEFLAAGGRFGIGSDSNVLIGVAEELRQLEFAQRLRLRERNVMAAREGASTGRRLLEAAVAGGGHALGFPSAGLAVGARADIVSLDREHPSLVARHGDALIDGFLFATRERAVDCVWAGGDKVVSGGRHRAHERIGAGYRATLRRLMERSR
jgi:formiminoglutamate deiminase